MRLTKFEHSCVMVEDGDARLLVDPGAFSTGWESLTGLTGVLITHQHFDHVDLDRLPGLLRANPQAAVHSDPGSVDQLAERGIEVSAVSAGDVLDLGTPVRVFGRDHAVIHPDLGVISNTGYLVGGRFFHPGDAFTVPDVEVEVLGLPAGAPWLKVSEAVDFLRAVAPRVAVPIHEAVLANPQMHYGMFDQLAPEGTELRIVAPGDTAEL